MDMVTLQETRCSGIKVNNIIKNLGFFKNMIIEACGFVGGIWWMWNID